MPVIIFFRGRIPKRDHHDTLTADDRNIRHYCSMVRLRMANVLQQFLVILSKAGGISSTIQLGVSFLFLYMVGFLTWILECLRSDTGLSRTPLRNKFNNYCPDRRRGQPPARNRLYSGISSSKEDYSS